MKANKARLDYREYFQHFQILYDSNTTIFTDAQQELQRLATRADGFPSFDNRYNDAIACIERIFGKNMTTIFHNCYMDMEEGTAPDMSGLNAPFVDELRAFIQFLGPIILKTKKDLKDKEQQAIVTLMAFKEAVLTKDMKTAKNLLLWMAKWTSYLPREASFRPDHLKAYKQREIILVDFGFNLGGEFGGRHYAVVLEKNNHPKSGVVLVAPITSYDPSRGQKPHPANIDLGIGAIHGYAKGAEVVTNQLRHISKMRIEKPKTSQEPRIYMDKAKFMSLLTKIQSQMVP